MDELRLYQAAVQGEIITVLHDLEDGRWFPLDLGSLEGPVRFVWVPERTAVRWPPRWRWLRLPGASHGGSADR